MNKEAGVIEHVPSRFRWLERGDGDPVVLLHGLMGEMDHWESTLETLGAFCRPIALELPLFDAGLVDVSVPGLADYVRRFMEALELRPSVVGGNSLGGHVALELALAHAGMSELRRQMYRGLARLGIGRDVFVVARKPVRE